MTTQVCYIHGPKIKVRPPSVTECASLVETDSSFSLDDPKLPEAGCFRLDPGPAEYYVVDDKNERTLVNRTDPRVVKAVDIRPCAEYDEPDEPEDGEFEQIVPPDPPLSMLNVLRFIFFSPKK